MAYKRRTSVFRRPADFERDARSFLCVLMRLSPLYTRLRNSRHENPFSKQFHFRSDRAVPRLEGGVAFYVKSPLIPSRIVTDVPSSCVETVSCQLFLPSRHITVLKVYRNPLGGDIVLHVL